MRRRLAAAAALLAVATLLTACGDDEPDGSPSASDTSGPRAVTAEESERLAASRFLNYQRERVAFELLVPVESGTVSLRGRADMREHRALAFGQTSGSATADPDYALFAWNLAVAGLVLAEAPFSEAALDNVGDLPDRAWGVIHPIDESTEPLDQVFRVLLNLALDRPDNAQLLRQNGATWRGSTTIQGTDVDIMTTTPAGGTLTYYVADDGTMVRVDVALGAAQPGTITFLDEDAVPEVPAVKALGPEPDDEPTDVPG